MCTLASRLSTLINLRILLPFVVKVGLEPNTVLDGLDNHLTGLGYHPALRPLDYITPFASLMDWLPYRKWGFPVISGLRGERWNRTIGT